jgi:hypothetical protein
MMIRLQIYAGFSIFNLVLCVFMPFYGCAVSLIVANCPYIGINAHSEQNLLYRTGKAIANPRHRLGSFTAYLRF